MRSTLLLLGAIAAGSLGAGCDPEPDTAGEQIEEAAEEVGDEIDDAN